MAFKRVIGANNPYIDRKLSEQKEEQFTANPTEVDQLEKLILQIAEKAFRRYAQCHAAPKETENKECQRYLKILKEML